MNKRYGIICKVIFILLIKIVVSEPVFGEGKCQKQSITGSRKDTILVNGLKRTYRIHVPLSFDRSEPIPLVIALHGGGGSADAMVVLTLGGFDTLSEHEGFIVVYPEGVEKHWNDGRGLSRYRAQKENIDDVEFISLLIDHLYNQYNIDRKRVYVTGMSNGAIMSFRLACELTDKIAAIAPVAGLMPQRRHQSCMPLRPVSVLIINSIDDPITPWNGGYFKFGILRLGKGISVRKAALFWAEFNGCSVPPVIELMPDRDPDDGTRVQRIWYKGGKEGTEVILYRIKEEGTEVILYRIKGGGHTWPGGYQYLTRKIIGKPCRDINVCEIIWNFFKKHKIEQ